MNLLLFKIFFVYCTCLNEQKIQEQSKIKPISKSVPSVILSTSEETCFTKAITIRYIPMIKETLDTFGDMFHRDNVTTLILDIDGTFYEYTKEFNKVEHEAYDIAFNKLKKPGDPTKFWDFKNESDSVLFKSVYKYLNVTRQEFEDAMGDMRYSERVPKNERLKQFLSNCKYRTWCFSSGLVSRARSILKAMELEEFVEGVICVDGNSISPITKPEKESFMFVVKLLGLKPTDTVYFFDDLKPNVDAALVVGLKAFLVKSPDELVDMLEEKCK